MNTYYQGVRIAPYTPFAAHAITSTVINYPGVRSKGSITKVVRKVCNDGKVLTVFSWNAFVSEEQLKKESKPKPKFLDF